MIQRIQSLYLLLGAVALLLMILTPVATLHYENIDLDISALGFSTDSAVDVTINGTSNLLFLSLVALAAGVMLMNIFLFSNRKRQMVIGRLSYLLLAAVVVAMVWYVNGFSDISDSSDVEVEKRIGYFMPIAALAFNFLAIWSISKDEKLVRSVDRLR